MSEGVDAMQSFMSELCEFLEDPREEVRREAATTCSGLTGSVDGMQLLLTIQVSDKVFPVLLRRMQAEKSRSVREQVFATLVNLSLDPVACKKLLKLGVVQRGMEILRSYSNQKDQQKNTGEGEGEEGDPRDEQLLSLTAKLLSNLTLHNEAIDQLLQKGKGPLEGFFVTWIVQTLHSFHGTGEHARSQHGGDGSEDSVEYFAAVLTNVSQDAVGRRVLLESGGANFKVIGDQLLLTKKKKNHMNHHHHHPHRGGGGGSLVGEGERDGDGDGDGDDVRRASLCRVVRNVFMGATKDGEATVQALVESGTISKVVQVLSEHMQNVDNERAISSGALVLSVVCRRALLEGLLCLAGDDTSRKALWDLNVPQILQQFYQKETDEELEKVLETLADLFVVHSGVAEGVEEGQADEEELKDDEVGKIEEVD